MAYIAKCACCKETKSLYYAKATPYQHCIKCHKLGYTKPTRQETTAEYFVRLTKRIEASPPPPPVILPPPRPVKLRVIATVKELTPIQQAAKKELEALAERKRVAKGKPNTMHTVIHDDKDLEELRQAKRREMDFNVKNYQPRQEYGSRTPLK